MLLMNCRRKEGGGLCAAFQRDDGTIEVSPEGGGFVFARFANQAEFENEFVRDDTESPYRAGLVTAEFLTVGVAILCYSNGRAWNGWGIPWFDEVGIRQVIASLVEGIAEGTQPPLKWEGGKLMVRDDFADDADEQGYYECVPADITVDGVTRKLWHVDGWTWDAVEFPEGGKAPGSEVKQLEDGSLMFWGERARTKYEECVEGVWSPNGVGRVFAFGPRTSEWVTLPKGDFEMALNSTAVDVYSENPAVNKWRYKYWPGAGLGLLVQEQ
jgi:hypothetical protein